MRVLVTGGAGYIGSHTIVELLNQGHQVAAIDNLSNSDREVFRRIKKITGKDVLFYESDVRDRPALEKIFAEWTPEWVIHFAGLKAVGESVAQPLAYYDNNLISTLHLLQTMQKFGVKRIIFSSSATVYGEPERLPLDENCRLRPTNPYGMSKYMQECVLRDLYQSEKSWTIVLLRYFNPVGAHESGLIGEDPKGIPNNLMPYVARVASGSLEKVHIFGDDYPTPDGTGVRDYLHVVDLAKGHLCALNQIQESGLFVYNLGTGKGSSVLEVVRAFSKACGRELPYEISPRRPGDVPEVYASADKALRELHWKAEYDLEKMCLDSWNWQKNNPHGYKF